MEEINGSGEAGAAGRDGAGIPAEPRTPVAWTFPSFEPYHPDEAAPADAPPASVVESPMPLSMPPFGALERPAPSGAADPVAADPAGAASSGSGGWEPPTPPYGAPAWTAVPDSPEGSAGAHRGASRRSIAVAVAGIVLIAGGLGAGLGAAFGGSSSSPSIGSSDATGTTLPAQASSGANVVQRVANAVDPAVVDINTTVATPEGQGVTQAAGTGMIISSGGVVLTNNHVVNQATSIRVTVEGHNGSYPAKVLGVDPVHDVALIKIQGISGLPTVSFGDSSSVAVGDTVVAIGNALGQGGTPTVVSGTISATKRTITAGDAGSTATETLYNLLQTTAAIQPGDSGGPLVNTKGQVIGMDTAAASGDTGTTMGFAIPINQARSIAAQIARGEAGNGVVIGESPFLGIYEVPSGSTSSPSGGNFFNGPFGGAFGNSGTSGNSGSSGSAPTGAYVSGVTQGGPAAAAGLQAGDTITAIDGQATTSFSQLHSQIAAHKPGDRVTVSYVDQSGASHSAEVTLGGLPS